MLHFVAERLTYFLDSAFCMASRLEPPAKPASVQPAEAAAAAAATAKTEINMTKFKTYSFVGCQTCEIQMIERLIHDKDPN